MSATERATVRLRKYHPDAYRFVFAALQFTQEKLDRCVAVDEFEPGSEDVQSGHISGGELVEGIREYALSQFGLMTRNVFADWNIFTTRDFGEIVFELVERGEMRTTAEDCIDDFDGVYDFEQALDADYKINCSRLA